MSQYEIKAEELRQKYNAISCMHRDEPNSGYIDRFKKILNLKYCDTKDIHAKINDNKITSLETIFENNEIFMSLIRYNLNCQVIDNKYSFVYSYNTNFKDTLIKIIKDHTFITNNDLYQMLKHKIFILQIYFINITDIYKYLLQIIRNIYLNDNDIILELFFSKPMTIRIS